LATIRVVLAVVVKALLRVKRKWRSYPESKVLLEMLVEFL